jgi:hypothetical protein
MDLSNSSFFTQVRSQAVILRVEEGDDQSIPESCTRRYRPFRHAAIRALHIVSLRIGVKYLATG